MQSRPQFRLFTVFFLTAVAACWCVLARREVLVVGEGLFVIFATFFVSACRRFKPWILMLDPSLGLGWGWLFDEINWLHGLPHGIGILLGMALGFVVMVVRVYWHYRAVARLDSGRLGTNPGDPGPS